MIDFKKTIINLHNEFPNFDLDTLMKIIDTIVEIQNVSLPNWNPGTRNLPSSDKPWYSDKYWYIEPHITYTTK